MLPVFLLLGSCKEDSRVSVNITLDGAPDSSEVVVSRLAVNEMRVLDTLYTRNGEVPEYRTDVVPESPEFFYVSYGKGSISLLLKAGDNVRVNASWPVPGEVSILGSPESELMQEVDSSLNAFNIRFDSLYTVLASMPGDADDAEHVRLRRELGKMFVQRKQEAIRYILSHKGSMTAVPVLYQETPNGLRLFSEATDVIIMESVYDTLYAEYPMSPYLAALADEIRYRRNALEMSSMLSSAEAVDFPEIVMGDIDGVQRALSSLKGKVVALVFWDPSNVEQRIFNVGLKDVYSKYHEAGFEIYQVSVSSDKTAWALQVREQQLPWISVCDPSALASVLSMYNITGSPAMFIISRDGEITAKDLFNTDMLESEVSRLL